MSCAKIFTVREGVSCVEERAREGTYTVPGLVHLVLLLSRELSGLGATNDAGRLV